MQVWGCMEEKKWGTAFSRKPSKYTLIKRNMEDFAIMREVPSYGINKIQASKDGQILIQSKNGFLMLNTNANCTNTKCLSDLYTLSRLSIPSVNEKNANFFANVVHQGTSKFDEYKSTFNNNDTILFTNFSISESGVNQNFKCLYLSVSDCYNGIIFNYENGSLNPIIQVNEEIAKLENLNMKSLLTADEIRKLRINYMTWMKSIDYCSIKEPIWPLTTSSLFFCFTETNENWIYRYNNKDNTISRYLPINIDMNYHDNEYVLYMEQTEWKHDKNRSVDLYISYLAIVTSKNRLIIKSCLFDISKNSLTVLEDFRVLEIDDYIVRIKCYNCNDKHMLILLLPNSIQLVNLAENLKEQTNCSKVDLDNVFTMDNLIHFNFTDFNTRWDLLLTNNFGELVHIRYDIQDSDISVIFNNKYDYQKRIESNELPLFDKLNDLTSNETIVIDSLNLDSTSNLIYMLYSSSYIKSKLEFSSSLKKDNKAIGMQLSIVKSRFDSKVSSKDIDKFNCIYSSPMYWKSMNLLLPGIEEYTTSNGNDTVYEIEEGGSLLKKLFLNLSLDKERLYNVIYNDAGNKQFKSKIQGLLAKEILSLMDNEKLDTNSEEDMFIYFQYCKILGRKIPERSICKMVVQGTNLIESFDAGNVEEREVGVIRSMEGHYWKLCDVTLLPIMSPVMKRCNTCGSIRVGGGHGSIVERVLSVTPLCVFCGGRYE